MNVLGDELGERLVIASVQESIDRGRVVEQTGPACHTNRESCFFTALRDGSEVSLSGPVD